MKSKKLNLSNNILWDLPGRLYIKSQYEGHKGMEILNNKVNQHFFFLSLRFSLWCFWREKTQVEAG